MASISSMHPVRSMSPNPPTIKQRSIGVVALDIRGWRQSLTSAFARNYCCIPNMFVKAGPAMRALFDKAEQSEGGCLDRLKQKLKLLGERRRGETTADNTNNSLTLQRQSNSDGSNEVRVDLGNIAPESPDTDPNNTLQRKSTSYKNGRNRTLKGHSTISKILCAANLVLIVAIVFAQLPKPTHPYRWMAIAELSDQSGALVAMMLGFYLQEIKPSAAMWLHRTGHLLFLEGLAVAAVYRFQWPPRFIPLVLLPFPAILIPIYVFV